ncbi:hypothetical protein GGI09_002812 [Coemansia sp. S100]|nr:hypothetical protein GGI09_002812 [Coemansia sp. S100]KAJ2108585.1 hypothetical protein GGI16_001073 [Coemansia sp. S142-1]
MEPSNIYVLHQGDGIVTPKKLFLFVFPYSENLTLDIMCQHAISTFGEKKKKLFDGTHKYKFGSAYDSVLQQGVEQRGSKKAIMTTYTYSDTTYLNVRAFNNATTRWMASTEFTDLEGKMNELIKLYETLTADTPALKLGTVLTSKNIYYYDERKVSGYTFDKRSPEGVEFIKAKLLAKKEKSSTQRTHNANAKHRDQCIDASRKEMQEE